MSNNFVALDVETAQGKRWSICQIGLVFFENNTITKTITEYIQPPENEYFYWNIKIHGITPEVTKDKPYFPEVWERIYPLLKNKKLVAHNSSFDKSCLNQALKYYEMDVPEFDFDCTYKLSGEKLNIACESWGITLDNHHDATCDAKACGLLYLKLHNNNTAINEEAVDNKHNKVQLKNKLAQKLLEQKTIEINGMTISLWTGQSSSRAQMQRSWNRIKSYTKLNSNTDGENGSIVITGRMQIPRAELAEYAIKLGFKVQSRVSCNTDFLIVGYDNVSPSKVAKAIELIESGAKIEFIDENSFLEMLADNFDLILSKSRNNNAFSE
ncbi:MAG: 3'-5' exoribonuclease [Salinivirgaceae bacterium]|nr:3'-5' exoribonuclease [Salinivirgaceae bacterium]